MKAAAEKATPGPWYVHDKPCEDGNYGIDTSDKEFLAETVVWWGFARQSIWREEDAKYIALANPANVLALVEELERKEEQRANWFQMAQKLGEDLDSAEKRIAELEREQEHLRPVGVMSEQAFHRLENSECRFIALWPRPGIFLQRKRPEDGVLVYARTAAAAGIKVEAE
ncbi:ead/Ea22-like family protein [Klebsiella pneumoniae]